MLVKKKSVQKALVISFKEVTIFLKKKKTEFDIDVTQPHKMISPAAAGRSISGHLLRKNLCAVLSNMANWATIPYELLTLIVDLFVAQNDKKSIAQFKLVCKHWNKPAAYISFERVNITNLHKFSSFVRLILANQALGAAIKYIYIDVKEHEQCIMDDILVAKTGDGLLIDAIADYENDRDETYRNLFSIILRFIPNVKHIDFSTKDNYKWYEVLEKYADRLKHLEVITPPASGRDFLTYYPTAWKLHETLKKMTFLNEWMNSGESYSSSYDFMNDLSLISKASEFTNLTEIRIELVDHRCHIPQLERTIDNVPTSVNIIAFSATSFYERMDTIKLELPEVDLSTTKPLPHIRKLRTLHSYFYNVNAIKYITHKFPNVQELEYRCGEKPWNVYLPDTPTQLSPSVQTMYFEYFMKMTVVNVFGAYPIEEFSPMMSRWMAVANTIKEKEVFLTLTEDGSVDNNCLYVFWIRDGLDISYSIGVHYNYESAWSYDMSIPTLGSCLTSITLENVDLTSEKLTTIYRGCPSLVQLAFRDVIILGEMDTGEVTSNLTHLTFKDVEDDSAKWIPSITKNLASLYLLNVSDTDMTVSSSTTTITSQNDTTSPHYRDLAFDISATHPYAIRYTPTLEMLHTHDFVPPWCVISNNKELYLNPGAFEEGPYKQIVFTEQVPLSDFEIYKKQIVPSKRAHSYCLRLQCQGLHCFQLTKASGIAIPDPRRDIRDKPVEYWMCLVIN